VNIHGARPLPAFANFVLDSIAFSGSRVVQFGSMKEEILSFILYNKPETLVHIKKLNFTFTHRFLLLYWFYMKNETSV